MPSLLSRLAIVTAIGALAATRLTAQTAAAPSALCFTPDDAAHCKRFVLLEGNMAFQSAASPGPSWPSYNVVHGALTWGLGGMQNVSANTAICGVVSYGFDGGEGARATAELRVMRWLPGRYALEGSAGLMRLYLGPSSPFGATTGVALTYRDLVGVTANVQTVHQGRQQSALLIGVRTGGWVTPVATGLLFGTIAMVLANTHWD